MSVADQVVESGCAAQGGPGPDRGAAQRGAGFADYVSWGILTSLTGSAFYLLGGAARALGELIVLTALIWVALGVTGARLRAARQR